MLEMEFLNNVDDYLDEYCSEAAGKSCDEASELIRLAQEPMNFSLRELAFHLDGYSRRVQKVDAADALLLAASEASQSTVSAVYEALNAELFYEKRKLYSKLGIDLSEATPYVPAEWPESIRKRAVEIDREWKSGWGIKLLDDAVEWIPLAGDAYGISKIAYDPRLEKKVYPPVEDFSNRASAALASEILNIRSRETNRSMLRTECLKRYDVRKRAREIHTMLL